MRLTHHDVPPAIPGWEYMKYDKLVKRVKALDNSMLYGYADQAGTGMARAFTDFQRHGQPVSLDEIEEGLMTLLVITRELRARGDSPGSD